MFLKLRSEVFVFPQVVSLFEHIAEEVDQAFLVLRCILLDDLQAFEHCELISQYSLANFALANAQVLSRDEHARRNLHIELLWIRLQAGDEVLKLFAFDPSFLFLLTFSLLSVF